jgi:hypothetical protein
MLELETNFVEHGTMQISMEMYTKDLDCGENTLHLEMDHGKLSAAVQNDDGSFTVKPEYMTQLAKITTPEILEAFLKNAFVKIKQLDNGDFKFEVNQKANGGGWVNGENLELPIPAAIMVVVVVTKIAAEITTLILPQNVELKHIALKEKLEIKKVKSA